MSKILAAPSEVLRTVAKPVEAIDKRVLSVIKDMDKALKEAKNPQGVGLAAPQIGVSMRIFMIRPEKRGKITTFINPQITYFSQRLIDPHSKNGVYEGCLSVPNHYAPVSRSMSVTIKYQVLHQLSANDFQLTTKNENYSGFAAHVIQHEMDHLNGILFIDRVLEQNVKLYRLDGKEWEEVGI
jgi:peptide deformylase